MSERLREAVKAKAELELTERAFIKLEAQALNQIADTKPTQAVEREALYHRVRALRDARQMLVVAASEADVQAHREQLAEAGFESADS